MSGVAADVREVDCPSSAACDSSCDLHGPYLGAIDPARCAACLAYPSLPCAQHRGHAAAEFACDSCGARPSTVGSAELHEKTKPGHDVHEIEEADR